MKCQVPIVDQNHPEPFDRRVWLESRAFASAAIRQGSGKPAPDVTIVGAGPDPQDGVDLAVRQELAYLGVYRRLVSLGKAPERVRA